MGYGGITALEKLGLFSFIFFMISGALLSSAVVAALGMVLPADSRMGILNASMMRR